MFSNNDIAIETLRAHGIQTVANYLNTRTFTTFCLGLGSGAKSIGGEVGMRRSKRFAHLLKVASYDGVIFLMDVLLNYSNANVLKSMLLKDTVLIEKFNKLKDQVQASDSLNKAIHTFKNFIDVDVLVDEFKKDMNQTIKDFSFVEIANPQSALNAQIAKIQENITISCNKAAIRQSRFLR